MATKKNPEPKPEEIKEAEAAEVTAEEIRPDAEAKKALDAAKKEIEQLKKQLAQQQKPQAIRGRGQDDAQLVREACREAAANGTDPWSVTVSIRAPRRPGKEDPWYWLNVNSISVQVPADDKYHDLKLPWAETLINMLEAERYAGEYQDGIEVYDPQTNPKPV